MDSKNLRAERRAKMADYKGRLNVAKRDPKMEYRIVNDVDGGARINHFLAKGWVVDTDNEVGDKRVGKVSAEGSAVQISVGQGTKAFLMKIPKEIYEIDQELKQELVDEREAMLKPEGTYGSIKIEKVSSR